MSTDPRIEAAAKALFESTRTDYMTWEHATDETRELYRSRMRKNVDAYLAAADKSATITTVEELDALGFEAVVLDPCGTPAVCQSSAPGFNEWALGGSGELIDSETLLLSGSSCTVLHRGTE